MQIIKNSKGIETIIFAETLEFEAYDQIKKLSNYHAYQDSKIRMMPDCHSGKGCTVGTTMTINDKLTPNLIGVDISCGVLVIKLKTNDIDLAKLDNVINTKVPSGFSVHNSPIEKFNLDNLKCLKHIDYKRALCSIGSLGGGNHYIELNYSELHNETYLVIHSGSRKLGNDVCIYYQNLAFQKLNEMSSIKEDLIKKLKTEGREKDINEELKKIRKPSVDKDLAFLTGDDFNDYIHDMRIVQEYATLNRATIAKIIMSEMNIGEKSRFETIHNYIDFKRMILRKGAVSAEKDELFIIPINMRDGSLLCIGKGNPEWNYSAPHGAGRLMSRSKAKETLNIDDYVLSMKDVYSTSVKIETIDESPMAYKPMDEIMRNISDTAEIIDIIKPIYNFKAN